MDTAGNMDTPRKSSLRFRDSHILVHISQI